MLAMLPLHMLLLLTKKEISHPTIQCKGLGVYSLLKAVKACMFVIVVQKLAFFIRVQLELK